MNKRGLSYDNPLYVKITGKRMDAKVYHCFPGGKFKALTMSYDDGYMEDVRLIELFNRYGIKGTFNLNSGMFDQTYRGHKRVPKEQIARLYQGHEVATHGYTHPTMARCPLVKVAAEILEDRKDLERLTGGLVRGHAYPNGSYNQEIEELLAKLGIAYGRVINPLPDGTAGYALPTNPMEWQPTCHHNDLNLMKKGQWLIENQSSSYLRLMYVWGHSYEFSEDDNWQVMEDFCQLMGHREDIWYATNIQIIDYMEVLKYLRFSGDGETVYNPSAQSAWLQVDEDRIVEVPGGMLIHLEV